MGCANAKAAGFPMSSNPDFPGEVTDGVGRLNYLNQPPPKVIINGDYLDNDRIKTPDLDDRVNGNVGNDVIEVVKATTQATQEIEFLTPPEPPTDDDKEAVTERTGDSPMGLVEDVMDDVTEATEVLTDRNPPSLDGSTSIPLMEEDEDEPMEESSRPTTGVEITEVTDDVNLNDVKPVEDSSQVHDAPGDEVARNEVTDDVVADDQVVDGQVADGQVAGDQVADGQVADDQVADDQVADDQVADDKVADDKMVHDKSTNDDNIANDLIVQDA